jgi:large conductance mechanosensitive channel
LAVKGIKQIKKKEEAAPPAPEPSNEEKLLTEIRDILKLK